jgi:hypothetical protein
MYERLVKAELKICAFAGRCRRIGVDDGFVRAWGAPCRVVHSGPYWLRILSRRRPRRVRVDIQADLLEQQWREVAQVPSPHSPVVCALCFLIRVLDARLLKRPMQGVGTLEGGILLAAGDPEQIDQRV